MNLVDDQCLGEVSFVQGLYLTAKEMKQGVTIISYIGLIATWICNSVSDHLATMAGLFKLP